MDKATRISFMCGSLLVLVLSMIFFPPFASHLALQYTETREGKTHEAEELGTAKSQEAPESWMKLPHRGVPPAVVCSHNITGDYRKSIEMDLSMWDNLGRRTGCGLPADPFMREDIPHSTYTLDRGGHIETITIDSPVTSGVWRVGCYAAAAEGTYSLNVIVKPESGGEEDSHYQVYHFSEFISRGELHTYEFEVPQNTAEITATLLGAEATSAGIEALCVERILKLEWPETKTLYGEYATLKNFEEILIQGPKILHLIAPGTLTTKESDPEATIVPSIALRDNTNPQTYTWRTPRRLAAERFHDKMEDKTEFVFLSTCYGLYNWGQGKTKFFGATFANWMGAGYVIGHKSVLLVSVAHTFVSTFYLILSQNWSSMQVPSAFQKAVSITKDHYEFLVSLGVGIAVGIIFSIGSGALGIEAGFLATLIMSAIENFLESHFSNNLSSILYNIDGLDCWKKVDQSGGGESGGTRPSLPGGSDSDYGKPYHPPGGGTIVIYPT